MNVTDEMIQKLAEKLSLQFFERPFKHRAYINKRLRTTGGRYLLGSHHIEVNEKYIVQYGIEELIGILKHELCHYHLHLQGKGYKHGDLDFKELLKKTNSPRYCKPLLDEEKTSKVKRVIVYKCLTCGLFYKRRRRMDIKKYVCGSCKGKLKEIKE